MGELLELIVDEKDKEDYKKYLNLKGEFLYLHVLNIFKDYNPNENFNYSEISSYIRYDKSLQKKLFGYLAYIEEYWRAKLLREYDIEEEHEDIKKLNFIKNNNYSDSKLYFYLLNKVSFGKLIDILHKNKLITKKEKSDLIEIKKIRNNNMHYKFLLIQNAKKWKDVEENIQNFKKTLKLIYNFLPNDYQEGFVKTFNELIKKKSYFTRINLGELVLDEI